MGISKVYFVKISDSDDVESRKRKFAGLINDSRAIDFIEKDDNVAIKTHFGEDGNTGHVKPVFLRIVSDIINEKGGLPVVTDSNALYKGRRTFTKDHIKLAREHGFTRESVGATVVIAEGEDGKDIVDVEIGQEHIKTAKIASLFDRVDAIAAVSHFKGHLLTGFGGALKNIGMGCASREGKLAQHTSMSPVINADSCVGCATCVDVCPGGAISIKAKKAHIDQNRCIGCAECIAACPDGAISVDFAGGADTIQEKMAEYALAALRAKKNKSVFINFAVSISQECDCWTKDYPRIAPDVGILISKDPVSVDKASYDLVVKACGKDVFKESHPGIDGMKQLRHASKIGLGNLDYELVKL
ncbi:MAG: DUF362 domain-containing protein [Candidatus Omnitrophota bacterium]|jgi:hypothetical protein